MRPIHTADVAGHKVRFYPSPLAPAPDFHWIAFRDVLALGMLTPELTEFAIEGWQKHWPQLSYELMDGTMVVPHSAAVGLFTMEREMGRPDAQQVLDDYWQAAADALVRTHGDLYPTEPAWRAFVELATLASQPFVPGHDHVH